MKEVYIYALCDKTGVKYIGKSIKPKTRLRKHIFGAITVGDKEYNYPKSIWIRENLEDVYQTIIEVCNDENWEKREKYWIKFYKEIGELTNQRPGGTGWHGHVNTPEQIQKGKETKGKFNHSEATKAHMSKIKKGKHPANFNIQFIPGSNKGVPLAFETKEKMSKSLKGRKSWNKGKKNEYTTARKGAKHSEETIAKIREIAKNPSDETRFKMSEAAKNRKHSEQTKLKHSERLKNNPVSKRATINIETGVLHNTLKEAYDTYPSINKRWGYSFVAEMVLDGKRNQTSLSYI